MNDDGAPCHGENVGLGRGVRGASSEVMQKMVTATHPDAISPHHCAALCCCAVPCPPLALRRPPPAPLPAPTSWPPAQRPGRPPCGLPFAPAVHPQHSMAPCSGHTSVSSGMCTHSHVITTRLPAWKGQSWGTRRQERAAATPQLPAAAQSSFLPAPVTPVPERDPSLPLTPGDPLCTRARPARPRLPNLHMVLPTRPDHPSTPQPSHPRISTHPS